jgi:hypothetical protein
MSFHDSIFFSGAIFQWPVFCVFRTTIARRGHEVKPQMQGIPPSPYPDHLVTIGQGKLSGPMAGFAATCNLGGRISRGLGHEENSRLA